MAIAVEASSQFAATATPTVDVTRPAGFTAASLGCVIVGSDNNTFDDPPFSISGSGWVEVAKIQTGSDDRCANIWRQFNPGDATSTITLAPATGPNIDDFGAHYLRVEGVDTTTPVDAVGTAETGSTTGGGNATVTSTVTTVTDGALAVCVFVFDGADGGTPVTFGSSGVGANGWGSLTNAQSGGGGAGVTVAVCTKAMPTAGDAGQVELDVPANDGWAAIMFALRPAAGGGGTDYDRSHADTVGLLDAAARTVSSARSEAETLGLADQISHSISAARAVADNLGLVDSLARGVAAERSLLDTAGLLDQVTRTGAFVRSIGDTLTLTDSLTFELTLGGGGGTAHVRSLADTLALSDTVARATAGQRGLVDVLGLTDSLQRSQEVGRALGSVLGLSDALSGFRELLVTLGDTLGFTDGLQRTMEAQRTEGDVLAFDDVLARAATSARALNAALGLSDALAHFILGGLSAPVQDCVLSAQLTDTVRLMASDTINPLRKCP